MEEEDLDHFVDHCASSLMSDEWHEVLSVTNLLDEVHDSTKRARIAQEIAAYKGGSVLRLLLKRLWRSLGKPCSREERSEDIKDPDNQFDFPEIDEEKYVVPLSVWTFALVTLANCKVTMDCSLREDSTISRGLAEAFASLVIMGLESLRCMKTESVWMLLTGLEGFLNFSISLRGFQDTMKQLRNLAHVFESFVSMLSKENLHLLGEDSVEVKRYLSNLILLLALSPDSQVWALDMGLLRIIAAIYEGTHMRDVTGKPIKLIGYPALKCNAALIRLLDFDASLDKLRQLKALSILKSHKRIINAVQPDTRAWTYMKAKILGQQYVSSMSRVSSEGLVPISEEFWKFQRRVGCGESQTRAVCSWKLCTSGPEPDTGKGYSRCAHCQVGHYCW
jgi:hypothetical protein